MFTAFLKKLGFFKPSRASIALYSACVGEAREPLYYEELAVADSVDGRFDLISLMVALMLHRIKGINDPALKGTKLGQNLFDAMFIDMDYNLRALGISDEGMKYRIREMSAAFMGRMRTYTKLCEATEPSQDQSAWQAALARNVYRIEDQNAPDMAEAQALAVRVAQLQQALAQYPDAEIAQGVVTFPPFSADFASFSTATGTQGEPQR